LRAQAATTRRAPTTLIAFASAVVLVALTLGATLALRRPAPAGPTSSSVARHTVDPDIQPRADGVRGRDPDGASAAVESALTTKPPLPRRPSGTVQAGDAANKAPRPNPYGGANHR
jgi:hypothetical protein